MPFLHPVIPGKYRQSAGYVAINIAKLKRKNKKEIFI